jgi:hypothetical protein
VVSTNQGVGPMFSSADATHELFRLDHGAGKDLDLPECPRAQLEKERIMLVND